MRITSLNAARIFGMYPRKGTLQKGSDADIVLLDLKLRQKVTQEMFGGFSDYTVYEGMELEGWPVKTIVRGQMVAEDFEVVGRPGHGRLVERRADVQHAQPRQ